MNVSLVELKKEHRPLLEDMLDEWFSVETDFSPFAIRHYDYHDFDTYLANISCKEEVDGFVPHTVYFLLDNDRNIFLGAIDIRHCLGQHNSITGGHIGDGIRPSERNKGYATAMIGLALEKCREMGLNKVLMTCDKTNVASARTIIKNGGVFESEVEEDGEIEQRYWITLKEETVETPRYILRRIMPADYPECFVWWGDERVYKYLLSSPVEKAEDILPLIYMNDANSRIRYVMLIRDKEDNHAIGTSGFFYDKDRDIWEFAYSIRFDEWGKGIATEVTKAMIEYLNAEYGAHSFEGECATENIGSSRVMEKLGMSFEHYSEYTQRKTGIKFRSAVYHLELNT